MKSVIEKARKAAGISALKGGNYPADPKQRGAGYWAAFIGALRTEIDYLIAECNEAGKAEREALKAAIALEKDLHKAEKSRTTEAVTALAHELHWEAGTREKVVSRIAN